MQNRFAGGNSQQIAHVNTSWLIFNHTAHIAINPGTVPLTCFSDIPFVYSYLKWNIFLSTDLTDLYKNLWPI